MSKKIQYESNEPSFLRKLKGQYGAPSDRHERPVARPRKQKDEDEDDDPTYVDEESHDTISREEYEKMLKPDSEKPSDAPNAATGGENVLPENDAAEAAPRKAVEASIGTKKRRLAKAVDTADPEQPKEDDEPPKKTAKKAGKKAQKVKLSFDDET